MHTHTHTLQILLRPVVRFMFTNESTHSFPIDIGNITHTQAHWNERGHRARHNKHTTSKHRHTNYEILLGSTPYALDRVHARNKLVISNLLLPFANWFLRLAAYKLFVSLCCIRICVGCMVSVGRVWVTDWASVRTAQEPRIKWTRILTRFSRITYPNARTLRPLQKNDERLSGAFQLQPTRIPDIWPNFPPPSPIYLLSFQHLHSSMARLDSIHTDTRFIHLTTSNAPSGSDSIRTTFYFDEQQCNRRWRGEKLWTWEGVVEDHLDIFIIVRYEKYDSA